MANPSLQIGNSNWAVKKDNLLGYSTAGTRFLPIPITMTRASAGTRVNPQGLVETVELLGSEQVTNGDFSNGGTGWGLYQTGSSTVTFPDVASINIDGINSNVGLYQQNVFASGQIYKIVVTMKATAVFIAEIVESQGASTETSIGNVSLTTSYQDFTFYFTATGTNDIFIHRLFGQTAGQNQQILVKNISVKESTRNDLARVDYTGSTSSLLAEPQRTNLITYSEDFTDSSWTKLGGGTGTTAVVTSNYAISPDGTQNATRLVCDLNGGTTTSDQSLIYDLDSSNTSQSISIYMKSNTGSNQNIYFANTYGTGDTAIVTSEWQRFEFNHSTSNHTFSLGLRGNTGADNTADILIWAAQSEAGSYPTSYIPTSGSTVTRVQDQYSKTGISDKINSTEGVLFLESSSLSNDGTSRCISIFQNGSNFIKFIYSASSNRVDFVAFSNGNLSCNIVKFISNTTENTKFGLKWKVNDFALWIDGVEVGTDLSGNTPLGMDKISFTNEGGSSGNFFGKVKQLQVFKTALTDSELATLTT